MTKNHPLSCSGQFDYHPPALPGDTELPIGWVAVHSNLIPSKLVRRKTHGSWVKISSNHATIFRLLRFSPNLRYSAADNKGSISLDWAGWLQLIGHADETKAPPQLHIEKTCWWHLPIIAMAHPDLTQRISVGLGVLSFALGLLSLGISVAAL